MGPTASLAGSRPDRGWGAAVAVVAVVLPVHVLLSAFVGTQGWDDGTITLAFSRTLAVAGKLALTPESEVVEGFSSPVWFLLLAFLHRLLDPAFGTFVRLSQLLAGVFAALSAAILYELCRPLIGRVQAALLAALLFVGGTFLNETMNGMEMTFLGFVALLIARHLERPRLRTVTLIVLAALLAATRFEAVVFLGVAGLALLVLARDRAAAIPILVGGLGGASIVEAWRLAAFGRWLPNTIAAKRWPPYQPHDLESLLELKAYGLVELALAYAVPLALTLLLIHRRSSFAAVRRTLLARRSLVFCLAYAAGVIAFNAAIGKNWGYIGRMQLSAVPLLVFVAVHATHDLAPGMRYWPVFSILTLLGSLAVLQWDHLRLASAAAQGQDARGITPETYRATGTAVDALRQTLGLSSISLMVPDVGGTSLCCPKIAIVDSGMLADRFLAAHGYAAFAPYLAQRRPDAIETHGFWSAASGIYRSAPFLDHYSPVVIADTWLWVRNDHLPTLRDRGARPSATPAELQRAKYRRHPVDEAFIAGRSLRPLVLP